MKIIIVGGGISGLSTYLFLQKYLSKVSSHSIKIYEKHHSRLNLTTENETNQEGATFEELSTSTAIVGGGLGVSPNGMRLLKELSPELRDAVEKQGYRAENFVFRSSRGWRLSAVQTGDKRIEDGEEFCVASSRHGLWECLRDHVVQQAGDDVLIYKKIVEVRCGEEGKKACVVFEDGSVEEADLIIGADGVRSVVKKGIFGVDTDGKEEFAPVYEYVFLLFQANAITY
jgi:2-polyprenyl-6-methoxyphenol hydroxylase-like FAD-dependent oxidoreductase